MKNPLTYWKYFVVAGTVNALVFVGYRLTMKYKQMSKLNEPDESVIIKTKKEDKDEEGKK